MAKLHIPLESVVSALPISYDDATIKIKMRTKQHQIHIGRSLYISEGYAIMEQDEECYDLEKYENATVTNSH